MNREQAKKLIRETFEAPFDKEKYSRFVSNLLKRIDFSKAFHARGYVNEAFKKTAEIIKTYERIGTYTDASAKKIDVLIVYLEKNNSLDKARTTMRNFVAQYLKNRGEKDAALVAFVPPDKKDWRFSLVKMDYHLEETPSGKFKAKEVPTPARRWSFLVGKNEKSHTAQSRFVPILENDDWEPTLEDLEQAFDVEVVTKEFFQKYRDLFIRTKLELDKIVKNDAKIRQEFEEKNINTVDFAKKLIGQITFLYFLQKKGWFGVERGKPWGTGPKDFMRRLFKREFGGYRNFYDDILEPLFYEALSTNRSAADHYYSQFNCKIPFLNGGLFDPINNYDWVKTDILIPDKLFSNNNKTKEGDIGDGILDVFDRYNFTVNEEEPLEKEVALDPELLGKTYEKLNAIRADNFDEYLRVLQSGRKGEETKFNKEYGVYYTPREIVHYMCQESLINYLATETSCTRNDIEEFVKFSDSIQEMEATSLVKQELIEAGDIKSTKYESQISECIRNNAKQIDNLLTNIKVCDPAVGSGAFPIGMMHEVVKLRQLLSIYTGEQVKTYDLKRHAIENSLYGVDIDPGAVEICKLRFWLSMIVDEEDFYNIKPLPNLDYKVVCGNSLLEVEKGLYNHQDFAELEKLKPQYRDEADFAKKQQLKNEIDRLIYKITKGHKEFDFEVYFSEVFREKGGFDIVIANPPYIQLQKDHGKLANIYKNYGFKTFDRRGDIYTLFYEKGLQILNNSGHLTFISSNKWMRAGYGEKLRSFFLKYNPKILIDLGPNVFESATVDTNILIIQKAKNQNQLKAVTITENKKDGLDFFRILKDNGVVLSNLTKDAWFIGNNAEQQLKEKIEHIGRPLKDWDVKIYYGIKTGLNEAFIIDSTKRQEILNNCKDEDERRRTEAIIKPLLRGRDIKRYYYEWAGLWVIIAKFGFYKQSHLYPAIVHHLKQYEMKLKNRGQCRYTRQNKDRTNYDYTGQHHWLELDNNPQNYYLAEFEKEKVVWGNISFNSQFSFVEPGIFISAPANIIVSNTVSIKFLCGVMNSKIFDTEFKRIGIFLGHAYEWKKQYVEQVKIPPITSSNKPIVRQIEELVDKILAVKKQNPQTDTNHWEREIDQLVYELYGLTEEEIKIVEGNQ